MSTNLDASEHIRTRCLSWALKTLKKTAVYSFKLFEANAKIPNGPNPPWIVEPLWPQTFCASYLSQLGSNGSALSKLSKVKVTSTSACHVYTNSPSQYKFSWLQWMHHLGRNNIVPVQLLFLWFQTPRPSQAFCWLIQLSSPLEFLFL